MNTRLVLIIFWFLILILNVVAQLWMLVSIVTGSPRATSIALGYDRLGNVVMGQGNETISSWAGRRNSWMEPYINKMFKILTGEDNHCDRNREPVA